MAKEAKDNKNNILKYVLSAVVGVAAFLIVFFLVKNPATQGQVVTYEYKDDSGMTMSVTYYAKADRVYKQTTRNTIPYKALGVSSKEEAKEMLDDIIAESRDVKGYTDELEYKDDMVIETVTVDYDVADIVEIKKLTGAYFDDGDTSKGVSLEKSIKLLEESGFTKVEK